MSVRVERIGSATLILGDCLDGLEALRGVAAVITDPPYSTPTAVAFGREIVRSLADLSVQSGYMRAWARLVQDTLTPDGRVLVFCDDDYYPVLHTAFYVWPFHQMVVWDKGQIGMGRCFRRRHELIIHAARKTGLDLNLWPGQTSHHSVVQFPPVPVTERIHGAQKPLALIEYLVKATTQPDDLVLDTFLGSGTTAVACARLGRRFVGFELDEAIFEAACARLRSDLFDSADSSIAAARLAEIERDPSTLISGPELNARLSGWISPPAADPQDERVADLFREPDAA